MRVTIRHEFLDVYYYVEFSLRETAYSFSDYLDCYEVGGVCFCLRKVPCYWEHRKRQDNYRTNLQSTRDHFLLEHLFISRYLLFSC